MIYLLIFLLLFLLIRIYFRLADHFNIIDKPNERSSHTALTIRGGGIVFYFAALFYFFWSGFQYPYFFLGLTLVCLISFLDDLFTLSSKLRIAVHFVAVSLLCYQLELGTFPWWVLLLILVVVIGMLNAYNFMDGINGITAMYSFAVLFLLWYMDTKINYIDERFLYCIALGNLVFTLFNFRTKAKCFAGDVGSVGMSFMLVFILWCLILYTQNFIYILFLAVYGIDSVLTIVHRLLKRENIFEPHRSHLYQYLSNEAKGNRLLIAFSYGLLQLLIGLLVIEFAGKELGVQVVFSLVLLLLLSAAYIAIKGQVLKRIQGKGI
ncbi:glycosyltransferase family 4 protein [Olivibacter sp. XZL3]|uniref:MraY family glycosyltransferase n=1 Tax=Olivibacter sp. XZL3 TaxID=1735116 RepID=UPI0010665CF0|nr:glycosyltransferase family 4 protein [Olivibacter sp. XZL3]